MSSKIAGNSPTGHDGRLNNPELAVSSAVCQSAYVLPVQDHVIGDKSTAANMAVTNIAPRSFTILLALLFVPAGLAAEKREWFKLTDCRYVAYQYNDGDSFQVKSGTNDFIVRLYFVDAPESNLRYPERTREQSEYFGATLDETMKAGAEARQVVRDLLGEPFLVWTRWASAAGRGRERRYYGIVEVNGKDLGEILLSKGLARTKGVSVTLPGGKKASSHVEKLRKLEDEARTKRAGIWARTNSSGGDRQPKPPATAPKE